MDKRSLALAQISAYSRAPLGHFIAGAPVAGKAEAFDVFEPAIGAVLGRARDATEQESDAAVAAAKETFPAWAATPAKERRKILNRGADLIAARADEIAAVECLNATQSMRVAEEEILGPVLTAIPFEDEADAIAKANDVEYGLSGYLWTRDVRRALRVSDALEAGMVWVNSENVRHLPTPFAGVKASGVGRDGGDWSFDFYMETKNVALTKGTHKVPRLGV